MLKIKDMSTSRTLDKKEMSAITGGTSPLMSLFSSNSAPSLSELIGSSFPAGGSTNPSGEPSVDKIPGGSDLVAPGVFQTTQSNDNDVAQLAAQIGLQSSF